MVSDSPCSLTPSFCVAMRFRHKMALPLALEHCQLRGIKMLLWITQCKKKMMLPRARAPAGVNEQPLDQC